ncbi:hypothetical protein DL770_008432 [Monosporascus sp. CRB-9-2]|nr:hypothetical protein DL770_008432 [Monosporascus sp. CRB-9-2]
MASSASLTPPAPVRLSPSVTLYNPAVPDGGAEPRFAAGPRLVVLATWAFAQDGHIAKYLASYRELFPGAAILVAKCFLRHFFWIPAAKQELEPAVAAIRSILGPHHDQKAKGARSKPSLVLHIFSNSGLSTAHNLCKVYTATCSSSHDEDGGKLPLHATVFDSSPGRYEYWSVASAVMFGVPRARWAQRLAALPLAHLLTCSLWVWVRLFGGQDWVSIWARDFNDPERILETCRTYAYSRADPLVEAHVVEAHAKHAQAQGFLVLYQADFVDSAHVSHARANPGRYWGVVKETWEGKARL